MLAFAYIGAISIILWVTLIANPGKYLYPLLTCTYEVVAKN
jgi:hypothetical protein